MYGVKAKLFISYFLSYYALHGRSIEFQWFGLKLSEYGKGNGQQPFAWRELQMVKGFKGSRMQDRALMFSSQVNRT